MSRVWSVRNVLLDTISPLSKGHKSASTWSQTHHFWFGSLITDSMTLKDYTEKSWSAVFYSWSWLTDSSEVQLSMSRIPSCDVLDSLCTLRICESDHWNCTTWRFIRRKRNSTLKSWKQWKRRIEQIRNFDYETLTSGIKELIRSCGQDSKEINRRWRRKKKKKKKVYLLSVDVRR